MRAPRPQNPYEIYCDRCNVSAPTGTRRCIHCGGRLSGAQGAQRPGFADLLKAEFAEAGAEEEELEPSIGSAAPKIVMWIVLLAGTYLFRFCN
jgi:hypothetical protein